MVTVQRQGKGSVLGIDNSGKAVQKRADTFRHDEWGHSFFYYYYYEIF